MNIDELITKLTEIRDTYGNITVLSPGLEGGDSIVDVDVIKPRGIDPYVVLG